MNNQQIEMVHPKQGLRTKSKKLLLNNVESHVKSQPTFEQK